MPLAKAISVVAAVADGQATEEETNQMTAAETETGQGTAVLRPPSVASKETTVETVLEATARGPTGPARTRQMTAASQAEAKDAKATK